MKKIIVLLTIVLLMSSCRTTKQVSIHNDKFGDKLKYANEDLEYKSQHIYAHKYQMFYGHTYIVFSTNKYMKRLGRTSVGVVHDPICWFCKHEQESKK